MDGPLGFTVSVKGVWRTVLFDMTKVLPYLGLLNGDFFNSPLFNAMIDLGFNILKIQKKRGVPVCKY